MLSNETIQRLKLETETIRESYDFWLKNISARAERLEKLCESEENNWEEIENLQRELEFWSARGKREELLAKRKGEEVHNILFGNLMSGISSMNLKY